MKKILAILMCLALMMTSFVIVSAEADATLTVATVSGPFATGDEIAIPVTITEWANAYATIELVFDYDDTLLTLDAIEPSETDFGGAMAASNADTKQFSLVCNPSSERQANKILGGEICVAYFYAATDITESISVDVTADVKGYAQGKGDNWIATQDLDVEIVNGGIYVEGSGSIDCTHEGGTATCNAKAICTLCGEEYGSFDTTNHVGGTEIRNASETYTGDTYCLGCDTKIAEGETIGAESNVVTMTVGTVEGPFSAGDEIAIPITVTEWANAYATIELEVDYNKNLLELDAIEPSETDFGGAMGAFNENKFSLVCNPSSDRQANKVLGGEICVAYFYAIEDIEHSVPVSATAAIKGYAQGKTDNWTETQDLQVAIENGGVHVEGAEVVYGYAGVTSTTAKQGDEVTLTVALGENTSLAVYEATLSFDETALKLVAMQEGDFCSYVNVESYTAGAVTNYNVTSGTLFTATFKVLANSGDYNVDVIFDADKVQRVNSVPVTMVVTPGVVSVSSSDEPEEYEAMITIGIAEDGPISAGDEIAIPVTITQWLNAYGCIEFELNYDKNILRLDSIEASETDFQGAMIASNEGKFGLIANPASDRQAHKVMGGEVCVAYFTALVDVTSDTDINFTYVRAYGYTEGKNDNWMNTKELYLEEVYGGIVVESQVVPQTGYVIVSNASGKKGEQITVTVSLGENTALAAYGATLVYDETALRLVSMDKGDFCEIVNIPNKHANGFSIANVTSGTLFTATFEIIAVDGDYTVDVLFDINSTANDKDEVVAVEVTAGTVSVKCAHEGGEATCCAKAVCTICGEEYGEFNAENHEGETEIRGAEEAGRGKEGYTGDLCCVSCGGVIEYGEKIPALTLWGDINGDDNINSLDAMLISQYYAGFEVEMDTTSADVNGDGYINARDAMLIAQYYVGFFDKFPVE